MSKVLAIIPARGGSKRLPRKNIKPLLGKPLIQYTIEAATCAKSIDHVVVSTEDSEITKVCEQLGVSVLKRPDALSSDTASSEDVLVHALENCGDGFDYLVLLQPTSPLRTSKHIDQCLSQFFSNHAKSVFSVCEAEHHPYKFFLQDNKMLKPIHQSKELSARHQDLPKALRQNGAIYCLKISDFLSEKTFYIEPSFGYEMPVSLSIDIDTEEDFKVAEAFLNR